MSQAGRDAAATLLAVQGVGATAADTAPGGLVLLPAEAVTLMPPPPAPPPPPAVEEDVAAKITSASDEVEQIEKALAAAKIRKRNLLQQRLEQRRAAKDAAEAAAEAAEAAKAEAEAACQRAHEAVERANQEVA